MKEKAGFYFGQFEEISAKIFHTLFKDCQITY